MIGIAVALLAQVLLVLSDTIPPPNAPLITIGGHTTVGDDDYTFVGGQTLAADRSGAYVIGTRTLRRGSEVTVSGTTYSLASNGRELVVDATRTSTILQGAGGYVPCFQLPIDGSHGGCLGDVATTVRQTSMTRSSTAPTVAATTTAAGAGLATNTTRTGSIPTATPTISSTVTSSSVVLTSSRASSAGLGMRRDRFRLQALICEGIVLLTFLLYYS